MTLASLLVRIGVDADEFDKNMTAVSARFKKVGDELTGQGARLTAGITLPLLAIGGAAIKLGMDAVESENLVAVSFGNMTGAAKDWAANLSDTLGLNRYEMEKTAGTMFNMTTSMGLGRDAAFEMSTGMVELAADMASFRNIGMDEALNKIRAGLVGETEPLKAIGILVDDNTIKTYAYKTGIAEQGKELTAQQKVLARYQAILAQTSNDQGDLARTLESPANQLRIMKERVKEAATALGMSLMPVVQQVVGFIAKGVPYLQAAVKWFGALPTPVKAGAVAVLAIVAALGPLLVVVGTVVSSIGVLLPLLPTLGGLFAGLLGPVGLVIGGLVALGTASKAATGSVFGFLEPLRPLWELLSAVAGLVSTVVVGALQLLWSWLQPLASFVGDVLVAAFKAHLVMLEKVGSVLSWVAEKIRDLTSWITGETEATRASAAAQADVALETGKHAEAAGVSADALAKEAEAQRKAGEAAKDLEDKRKAAKKAAEEHRKEIERLTKALTGGGAIEEARNYMDALKGVRDMSKLTVAAQKQVLDVVGQAIDVFKAAGKEIPPELRKVYDELVRLVVIPEAMKQANAAAFAHLDKLTADSVETFKAGQDAKNAKLEEGLAVAQEVTQAVYLDSLNGVDRQIELARRQRDGQLKAIEPLKTSLPAVYEAARRAIDQTFDQLVHDAKDSAEGQVSAFRTALKDLPSVILGAIQGGGDIGKAVGGSLLGAIGTDLQGPISQGLGKILGPTIGGALGSIVPGLGTWVGSALGGLVSKGISALGKLFGFGKGKEAKETQKLRDELLKTVGGMAELRKMADKAGVSIDKLLSTKKPEEFKKEVEKLNKALEAQGKRWEALQRAVNGINLRAAGFAAPFEKLAAELQKAIDGGDVKLSDKIKADLATAATKAQPEFDRLAMYAGVAFRKVAAETGSVFEALKAVEPTLAVLDAGIQKFGLSGSEAIAKLLGIREIVNANADVFQSLDGLAQMLAGFGEAGLLTRDLFQAIGADIGAQFQTLIDRGVDMNQAMALMQPTLQTLWEHQQKFGTVTDETTAKLLKQAEEQGLVGEHQKDVMERVLDVLVAIGKALGADLPKAAREGAQGVNDALSSIKVPEVTVPVKFVGGAKYDASGDGEIQLQQLAKGGITLGPTIAEIGEKGREVVAPLSQLPGLLAGALRQSGLFAEAPAATSTPTIVIEKVELHGIDGPSIQRLVDSGAFLDALERQILQNPRNLGTAVRTAAKR